MPRTRHRAPLLLTLALTTPALAADPFATAPATFNNNGGWSWFSDPRAIIDNNQFIIGSVAGTTANGATAGDVNVTSVNLSTGLPTETLLHAALEQDDHDVPAFSVLPDGRILAVYQKHGANNNALWRVSSSPGETTSWNAEQTSVVNTANDGNGNTYANPFYLSTPNEVVNLSRAVGYDPNYSLFTNLTNTTPTFAYGGHWMYWKNPNTGPLTGGNGRPYVKYASNGADTIWFATTEDSPQNFDNSLYAGYMQFTNTGSATLHTSTGASLGNISTATAPTGSANPPTSGNAGDLPSGTGLSYLPTDFTPIVKANATFNGIDLTGKSVGWASSMQIANTGNPYLGFVVIDNLNGGFGNDLEYYYAHFSTGAWHVDRVGFAGLPLYNGQNQYAGLLAVDPLNPNRIFFSADVNPATNATLLGPDSKQHWQIFEGNTTNNGTSWSFTQLTNTPSDNLRPVIAASPDGNEGLTWMRGSYTAYTNFNTAVVGLVIPTTGVSLTWNSTAASAWDINASFNWSTGAAPSAFFNGNNITFPDGPGLHPPLTLNPTLTPPAIAVPSNPINDSLSRTGTIAGTASLPKSGTSTLTLATPNTYSGGTILSAGTLIAANPEALGTGPLVIHANATLQLQPNLPKAVGLPSLTFDGSPNHWSGALDLTNNKLILQSTNKSADLANLQNQINTVITSSTLPANYAIAIVDNAITNFTNFGNQPVNSNSLLLSPELLGDTNLDGKIDLTDLSTVLNNFGLTTPNWTDGNFDNAPTINLTDLSNVLNNFGQSNPNASDFQLPITSYQLPTPVPEPTSLALLIAPLVLPRRRQSHLTNRDRKSFVAAHASRVPESASGRTGGTACRCVGRADSATLTN